MIANDDETISNVAVAESVVTAAVTVDTVSAADVAIVILVADALDEIDVCFELMTFVVADVDNDDNCIVLRADETTSISGWTKITKRNTSPMISPHIIKMNNKMIMIVIRRRRDHSRS